MKKSDLEKREDNSTVRRRCSSSYITVLSSNDIGQATDDGSLPTSETEYVIVPYIDSSFWEDVGLCDDRPGTSANSAHRIQGGSFTESSKDSRAQGPDDKLDPENETDSGNESDPEDKPNSKNESDPKYESDSKNESDPENETDPEDKLDSEEKLNRKDVSKLDPKDKSDPEEEGLWFYDSDSSDGGFSDDETAPEIDLDTVEDRYGQISDDRMFTLTENSEESMVYTLGRQNESPCFTSAGNTSVHDLILSRTNNDTFQCVSNNDHIPGTSNKHVIPGTFFQNPIPGTSLQNHIPGGYNKDPIPCFSTQDPTPDTFNNDLDQCTTNSVPIPGTSTQEIVEIIFTKDPIPGTSTKNPIPGTSTNYLIPDTSTHDPIPGTSTRDLIPGASTNYPIPCTSSNDRIPGTSTNYPIPCTSSNDRIPGASTNYPIPGTSTNYPIPGTSTQDPIPGSSSGITRGIKRNREALDSDDPVPGTSNDITPRPKRYRTCSPLNRGPYIWRRSDTRPGNTVPVPGTSTGVSGHISNRAVSTAPYHSVNTSTIDNTAVPGTSTGATTLGSNRSARGSNQRLSPDKPTGRKRRRDAGTYDREVLLKMMKRELKELDSYYVCPADCPCKMRGAVKKPTRTERRFRVTEPLYMKVLKSRSLEPVYQADIRCCDRYCCLKWYIDSVDSGDVWEDY